jgi:hypothetical protein
MQVDGQNKLAVTFGPIGPIDVPNIIKYDFMPMNLM